MGQTWLRILLPTLVLGFSTAALGLARGIILLYNPHLWLPLSLLLLGLVVAGEGVLVSLVSKRAPGLIWRLCELIVIYLVTYFFAYFWAPFGVERLFQPEVLISFGLIYGSWLIAITLGGYLTGTSWVKRILSDQQFANLAWTTESLLSGDNHQGITAGTRQVSLLLSGLLLLAGLFILILPGLFPERAASVTSPSIVIPAAFMFLCGLLLQANLYFYHLSLLWQDSQVEQKGAMGYNWLFNSVVITASLVTLGLLFPGVYLTWLFRSILALIWNLVAPWFAPKAEFPFAMEFPEQPKPIEQPPLPQMPEQPPELTTTENVLLSILFISIVLLLVFFVLVVIGGILYWFYDEELEKLSQIVKLPVKMYLWVRETIRLIFANTRNWTKKIRVVLRDRSDKESSLFVDRVQVKEKLLPSAPALFIRELFISLTKRAIQHGVTLKPSATPLEYQKELVERINAPHELNTFVEMYNKARYSNHRLTNEVKDLAYQAWKKTISALGSLGGNSRDE